MSLTNTAVERMLKVFTVLDNAVILDDNNEVKGTGQVSWTTPSNNQIKTTPFSISVESGDIEKLELTGTSFKTNVTGNRIYQGAPPRIQYADSYEELFTDKSLFSTASEWGIGFKNYGDKIYPFKLHSLQWPLNPSALPGVYGRYEEIPAQYNYDPSAITQDSYDFVEQNLQGYDDSYVFILKINSEFGSQHWLLTCEAYEYTVGTAGNNQKSSYNLGSYTSEDLNLTKLSRFKFPNGVTERLEKL